MATEIKIIGTLAGTEADLKLITIGGKKLSELSAKADTTGKIFTVPGYGTITTGANVAKFEAETGIAAGEYTFANNAATDTFTEISFDKATNAVKVTGVDTATVIGSVGNDTLTAITVKEAT